MISLGAFVTVGAILFTIGLAGVLLWRNLLIMLMSIEIMLNGVNLIFIAYASHWQNVGGQIFALFVMLVTAAEVAVALALLVLFFKRKDTLDTTILSRLRH
jgi:NADH-quinone oxidoreductase subunit K